jgi:predicted MFS family arabinose efflux permease
MGALVAATLLPALLIGLVAGVLVDRFPSRSVMLTADAGRFVILLTVPVAALLGSLHMEQLYLVAFLTGGFDVLFLLTYRTILPSLIEPDQIVEANARLRTGEAVADSVSPPLGGGIVQVLGAPVAVLLDALSFLASGLLIGRIAPRSVVRPAGNRRILPEAMDGIRTSLREPSLRAILAMNCTYGFFASFLITLFALRALRELGLSPLALGFIAVGGGLGSFAGAFLTTPMTRWLGIGPTVIVSYLLAVLFDLTIPLAGGPALVAFAVLFVGNLMSDVFYVVENVSSLSIRQAVTPPGQLGRVNATFLVFNRLLRPLGAIVAGVTAEIIGLQAAMFIGVAGTIAGVLWLVFSPLRGMKTVAVDAESV